MPPTPPPDSWWTRPLSYEEFSQRATEEAAKKDTMATTYEAPWVNKRRKAATALRVPPAPSAEPRPQ